jgi:hypothetical protein
LFWFKLTTDRYSLITVVAGGVPERLNGTVSKIVVGATPPRVRIPPPPPKKILLKNVLTNPTFKGR